MVRHFQRKTLCPDRNNLNLTPEIIDTVLNHHQYHPPPKNKRNNQPPTINNIINNINTMNNFINHMTVNDKIQHLMKYQDRKLLNFEDSLGTYFDQKVEKLENNGYRYGCYLTLDDIIELFNNVTKIDRGKLDLLNIFFDKTIKRIMLYQGDQWELYFEDLGTKEVISLIKSYFLDIYEMYLVRNLHQETGTELIRPKLAEHLEIYYRFIAVFDLTPHIQHLEDVEILGHHLVEHNPYSLSEKYMNLYYSQKRQTKMSENNRIRRQLVKIVRENTVYNLNELNKAILEIIKFDDNFKTELSASLQIETKANNVTESTIDSSSIANIN